RIQVLGLIIQVLKKPHLADLDLSGTISGREAILLGISLSVDSLGAGIAISFLGYGIIATAICTGICQVLFTYLGLMAGNGIIRVFQARQIAALPGVILIMLGITKLY
ncbi:MAG: manganese efflux pump, partial [Desulfocucumaceae bacterium]